MGVYCISGPAIYHSQIMTLAFIRVPTVRESPSGKSGNFNIFVGSQEKSGSGLGSVQKYTHPPRNLNISDEIKSIRTLVTEDMTSMLIKISSLYSPSEVNLFLCFSGF